MRGAHWLRPPHPALRATFSPLGRRGPESACPSKKGWESPAGQTSQKTLAGRLRPATDRLPTNHCNRSTMRLPNMRRRRGTPSSPQRGEVPSECEAMRGPSARCPLASPPSSGATRHLLPDGEKRTGERLPSKARSLRPNPDRVPTNHCHHWTVRLRPCGAGGGHPLLPSGEKCRVKRGDEGGEATTHAIKAPSSGATRHLLPAGEKRDG